MKSKYPCLAVVFPAFSFSPFLVKLLVVITAIKMVGIMSESTMGDRVNGTLLPQFNGKKVCIVGLVSNMNSNGLTFDINTVDDVTVKVNLRKPQRDILEGYVEVFITVLQGNLCNIFLL